MKQQKPLEFSFVGQLVPIDLSPGYVAIIIPMDIVEALPIAQRHRAEGFVGGVPFALAIQRLKTGERYFLMGSTLRKKAKLVVHDHVEVKFVVVENDKLDLPEEMLECLAQDDEARKMWDTLTVGKKRSLAHYVTTVKSVDSKIKRALELLHKLKTNTLYITSGKKEK